MSSRARNPRALGKLVERATCIAKTAAAVLNRPDVAFRPRPLRGHQLLRLLHRPVVTSDFLTHGLVPCW